MRKPNKATRLKHYKLALHKYESNELSFGLCIELAHIVYGCFSDAPWTYFEELNQYYPELTNPNKSKSTKGFDSIRIGILKKAIKQLEP